MSEEKITQLIRQIHDEGVHVNFVNEAIEETKSGVPLTVSKQLSELIKKAESSTANVVAFPEQKSIQLGTTNLLAAAGKSLGKWYENPLTFSSSGIVVDIRRILGTDDEVEITFQAQEQRQPSLIMDSLQAFKAKDVAIRISINEKVILNASIYIDENADYAEGRGVIIDNGKQSLQGELRLEILL